MAVAKTMQPAPVKPHLMETIDVQPNNRVAAKFLYKKINLFPTPHMPRHIQFLHSVCRPGNREKLRYSQAELDLAIKSALA